MSRKQEPGAIYNTKKTPTDHTTSPNNSNKNALWNQWIQSNTSSNQPAPRFKNVNESNSNSHGIK